jgi:hypothetical protein
MTPLQRGTVREEVAGVAEIHLSNDIDFVDAVRAQEWQALPIACKHRLNTSAFCEVRS